MTRLLLVGLLMLAFLLGGCGSSPPQENSSTAGSNMEMDADSQNPEDEQDAQGEQEPGVESISPEEVLQIMGGGGPFLLLDVRSEEEYRESRIEGALLLPDSEIRERAEAEIPDKDMLVIVYCRGGVRSAQAAGTLVDMGYTNVRDLGGIIDWPYETTSG